jgi:hypothetical protein
MASMPGVRAVNPFPRPPLTTVAERRSPSCIACPTYSFERRDRAASQDARSEVSFAFVAACMNYYLPCFAVPSLLSTPFEV